MLAESDTAAPNDSSGVAVLVLLLRLQGIGADVTQLTHQYGQNIGTTEMLRCAKDLKLKARSIGSTWERLAKTTFPAIGERREGSFFIISKVASDAVLILDPAVGRPQSVDRAEFESHLERSPCADDAPRRAGRACPPL
jgi:subfamily B ATP-binding cassette protein HlyB/CyaB